MVVWKKRENAPLNERLAAALGKIEKKILEKEKASCIEERNEDFDVVAPIFSKWWSLARGWLKKKRLKKKVMGFLKMI